MKKKANSAVAKANALASLIEEVRRLVQSARRAAATSVNTLQVLTNFEIGRRIVEHEQQGRDRAEYGRELLKHLAAGLTVEFGRGYSETNLKLMRQFYVSWTDRFSQVSQIASAKSLPGPIGQTLSDQLDPIRQMPSGTLPCSHK